MHRSIKPLPSKEKVAKKGQSKERNKASDKVTNKTEKKEIASKEKAVEKHSRIENNRETVKKQSIPSSGLTGQDLIREYNRLSNIDYDLSRREEAVEQIENIINNLKQEISGYTFLKLFFKSEDKSRLEGEFKDRESQVYGMKRELKNKYNEYGYSSKQAFDKIWLPVKRDYQKLMEERRRADGETISLRDELERNIEKVRENEQNRERRQKQKKRNNLDLIQ